MENEQKLNTEPTNKILYKKIIIIIVIMVDVMLGNVYPYPVSTDVF